MESRMSESSIDPNLWGPSLWDILFYIAFNVNLATHCRQIHELFHLLEIMLPCSGCRRHYAVYKKEIPAVTKINRKSPDSAAEWLWIIHNLVNKNLGKISIDFDTLKKKHSHFACMVSDLTVFDIIVDIWMGSSLNKLKVSAGIITMLSLLESIHPFRVCHLLKGKVTSTWRTEDILTSKNELLLHYNFPPQSLDVLSKNLFRT